MSELPVRKTEPNKDEPLSWPKESVSPHGRPNLRSLPPLPLPPPPAGPLPRAKNRPTSKLAQARPQSLPAPTRPVSMAPPLVSQPSAPDSFPLPSLADPSEAIPLRSDAGTAALVNDPLVQRALDGLMANKETSMHRLWKRVGSAGGQTKARFGRLVEHLRLLYQLKLVVQAEHVRQKARIDQAKLNKWVVSAYKGLGFTVLTVIVLALVSYMGQNVFFWFSSSWMEPTVIAPTDEHVLSLSTKLAEQEGTRDRLVAELADADRVIAMHQQFLADAHKAIADELSDRQSELGKLTALGKSLSSTRTEVRNNGRAYTNISKKRLAVEFRSRLIDREAAVTGAMQLSQIAQGNLSLAEKGVELDKRTNELSRETESLSSILSSQPATRHSYEVLRILQDLKRSELELAKARDNRTVVAKSLARYEHMIATLTDSPYLRAVQRKDTIAFVPYENMTKSKPGAPVYACAMGPLFCHKVGSVVGPLAGEMAGKHPTHNTMLRGEAVQVALTDARAAEQTVLFVGSRPVLF
jgi:hypothetical protein